MFFFQVSMIVYAVSSTTVYPFSNFNRCSESLCVCALAIYCIFNYLSIELDVGISRSWSFFLLHIYFNLILIMTFAIHFTATFRRPWWKWPSTTGSSTATVGSAFLSVRTIQYKLNRAQGRELALSLFALSLFRSSFFRSSLFRSLLCRSLLCRSLLYRFF